MLTTVALAAQLALAQIYVGPGGVSVGVAPIAPIYTGGYNVSYQPHPQGFTQLQVIATAGVQLAVYDGYAPVANGVSTLITNAYPGHVYRVDFVNPDGSRWSQNVAAQAGMIATLGYGAPVAVAPAPVYAPPPPPASMAPADFANLEAAINGQAFPKDKIAVLASASQSALFNCWQVGQLIDLYAFPDDKVRVARLTHRRIVDPGNEYTLYAHYAFPNDKERVRRILAEP